MTKKQRTLLCIVFASGFALAGFRIGLTQQAAQVASAANDKPSMTIKTKVNEVVLPVTVRDKKGQIVGTLKQEDFVLTDDGRPQAIKSFSHGLNLPLRLGLLIDTSRS